ncbi:MAG: NAD(P)-dependent oxidoreductase, partial [Kiloniellales bacterium]|nr:NAD(P)-dependent oxidoreductase [Kiloniellales bacterium]
MRYFPTFLDLTDRHCLIVGGGAAALAKLRLMLNTPAKVTLVAPGLDPEAADEIRALSEQDRKFSLHQRHIAEGDLAGVDLLYVASDDEVFDEKLALKARDRGIAVNVVDRPHLSTFITPAIVDRDPLVVAISSGGGAPILARNLRARIEALLPVRLGRLARFADTFRGAVRATVREGRSRRHFWERFFTSSLAHRILKGEKKGTSEEMLALVNGHRSLECGSVALVGAGPGDPDLLTFKALHYLQEADLVIYDRLVGQEILEYARRDAERVYAGKAKGAHVMAQAEINRLMLTQAKRGKRVVRLKGGD